jgi:hypothetical protein
MIKIEFNENSGSKQSNDVRLKRKMMTSAEKFHSRKKNNYASSLRDAYGKAMANEKANYSYLTIGTHAIRKMEYNNTLYSKAILFPQNVANGLKKRFDCAAVQKGEVKSLGLRKEDNSKVLILRKNETSNRLEDLLFKNGNPARKTSTARFDKEKMALLTRPNREGKVHPIEDYIPVRKSISKNQPFVFGMS